ncbi:TIGR02449 family protein [Zhongshania sp.]|uniref:TIGR02449 family protein n=1 Tax=Zhongshania sp. TaxID=1971902 RepID=UPI0035670582
MDELVQLCEQLDKENRVLKADARHWRTEREQLIEKTDIARTKIESMIQRLRALEKES